MYCTYAKNFFFYYLFLGSDNMLLTLQLELFLPLDSKHFVYADAN